MEKQVVEEAAVDYTKEPETLDEAKQQISYWKYKYYTTLDKYIEAIERKK